jgi:hypothetical protein
MRWLNLTTCSADIQIGVIHLFAETLQCELRLDQKLAKKPALSVDGPRSRLD